MSSLFVYILLNGFSFADESPVLSPENSKEVQSTTDNETKPQSEVSPTEENNDEKDTQPVWVRLKLKNGLILIGTIQMHSLLEWSPDEDIEFTIRDGEPSIISGIRISNIEMMEEVSELEYAAPIKPEDQSPKGFDYINPAASRYLYAPSSIGLQKGQGYVSQKLVFTTGVYAITDNLTVLAGALTFFPPMLTVFGGKYSVRLSENIHLGFGGELFILGFDSTMQLGIGFGSLTFGDSDRHLTVASGYMYDSEKAFTSSGSGIPIMIAGHNRFSTRGAIVTENWLLMDPATTKSTPVSTIINSVAFRLIGKRDKKRNKRGNMVTRDGYPRSTWDLGFAMVTYLDSFSLFDPTTETQVVSNLDTFMSFGPMPWIDYSWHFGPATKKRK